MYPAFLTNAISACFFHIGDNKQTFHQTSTLGSNGALELGGTTGFDLVCATF
ncbi:MAG: hypothetical protein GKR96_08415 [Gammaproteobacteria bacterium]|nr:hypothetical protein [Gammaproteobacteria bacterium]